MKMNVKKLLLAAAIGVGFGSTAASAFDYCNHLDILCKQYNNHIACADYNRYCK